MQKYYFLLMFWSSCLIVGMIPTQALAASITITAPAQGATVIGKPLSITGTSSQANMRVRLFVNATEIGSATTNGSGNWGFSTNDLNDGGYSITAKLTTSSFETLATDTNTFTVANNPTILITEPADDGIVNVNPVTAYGSSSLPSTTVELKLDTVLVDSTTTDSNGNWEGSFNIVTNGSHALVANLVVLGSPVATASHTFNALIPIIFPSGVSQIRIVDGDVPTTGSGSGTGFTYSVSGSIVTLTFVPAFSSAPSVIATGQRAAGASTATISSISATAANITFSLGTQRVHFTASALS